MAHRNKIGHWHGKRTLEQSLESFWMQVEKTDTCWNWTGNRNRTGYGQFKMPGMSYRTHRASWQIHRGEIPEGMHVLHTCDNPSCVNPDHLFLGTHTDNMRDAARKGRIRIPKLRGQNHPRAKLKECEAIQVLRLGKILSHEKVAAMFGIARSAVSRICTGVLWSHLQQKPHDQITLQNQIKPE